MMTEEDWRLLQEQLRREEAERVKVMSVQGPTR